MLQYQIILTKRIFNYFHAAVSFSEMQPNRSISTALGAHILKDFNCF